MKETIFTKPLRMPDDAPSRTTTSIKITEDEDSVTKVEKFENGSWKQMTTSISSDGGGK